MRQFGNNTYRFGDGVVGGTSKYWLADIGTANLPGTRYETGAVNAMQFSNDGINWLYMYGALAPFTPGQVIFAGATGQLSGSNNFFYDAANGRLGIGTNAPNEPFVVSVVNEKFSIKQNGTISQRNVFGTQPLCFFANVITAVEPIVATSMSVAIATTYSSTNAGITNSIQNSVSIACDHNTGPNFANGVSNPKIRIRTSNAVQGVGLGSVGSTNAYMIAEAGYHATDNKVALAGSDISIGRRTTGPILPTPSTVDYISVLGHNISTAENLTNLYGNVFLGYNYALDGTSNYTDNQRYALVFGVNEVEFQYISNGRSIMLLGANLNGFTPNLDFAASNYILQKVGIPPISTPADSIALYAKDFLGTAGQASTYDRTEDGKILSMRDAAHREAMFYKIPGAATYEDQFYQGLAVIEGESISDSISTHSWSTALDDGAFAFTAHASLAAMQTWINSNVSGNKFTGTKWILRATSTPKSGRTLEAAQMTLFFIREQ